MQICIDHGGTYTDLWAQEGLRRFHTKVATTDDLAECLFDGLQDLSGALYGLGDLSRLVSQARRVCHGSSQEVPAWRHGRGPRLGLVCREDLDLARVAALAGPGLPLDRLVGGRVALLNDATVAALALPGSDAWSACAAQVTMTAGLLAAQGAERIVVSLGQRQAEGGFMTLAVRGASRHLLGSVPLAGASEGCECADAARTTWTALLDAFLHPALQVTVSQIEGKLQRLGCPAPLLLVGSDGLAATACETAALRTREAGAQAAYRGAAARARAYDIAHLIALDIGACRTRFGTVTAGQVPLCGHGDPESGAWISGLARLRSLALGGHSVLQAEAGVVRVGPGCTGSQPGPACLGHGGDQATLTDLKLVQGQIEPRRYFAGRLALHVLRAEQALMQHVAIPLGLTLEAALQAADQAWVDTLAGALRSWAAPGSVLCAYGGAGPLAACAVAEALGLRRVLVPGSAAVFGASVLGQCPWGERHDLAVPGGWDLSRARRELAGLVARAQAGTVGGAFPRRDLLAGEPPQLLRRWWWAEAATARELDARCLPEVLVRHRNAEPAVLSMTQTLPTAESGPLRDRVLPSLSPRSGVSRRMSLGGNVQEVPLLVLQGQPHGARGAGPAVIEDDYFTLPVPAGWQFRITLLGDIDLQRA